MTKLVKEQETAARVELSVQTLRNHRTLGIGIPYVKLGKKSVRYTEEDIERFIQANRVETRAAR